MSLKSNQVCEYWLYSKIGLPKDYQPWSKDWSGHIKALPKDFDVSSAHIYILDSCATVTNCAEYVESTTGYGSATEKLLREFFTTGFDDVGLLLALDPFLSELEKRLKEHPVYPAFIDFSLSRLSDAPTPWTARKIRDYVGVKSPQTVLNWLNEFGIQAGLNPWNGHWWGTLKNIDALENLGKKYNKVDKSGDKVA